MSTSSRPNKKQRKRLRAGLPQICVYCGSTDRLTLDHIVAQSFGGSHDAANMQMLCWSCNHRKGRSEERILATSPKDRTEEEWAELARSLAMEAELRRCLETGQPAPDGMAQEYVALMERLTRFPPLPGSFL